jgi:CRP-like cAMP-binding protein
MDGSLRFVGPVERLLYLQSIEFFRHLAPEDLARIAQSAHERSFRAGATIFNEGEAATSLHIIVEGEASLRRGDRTLFKADAPGTVGLLALLAGGQSRTSAVADTDVVTLEQSAADVMDLLKEDFQTTEGIIRAFTEQLAQVQRRLERSGTLQRAPAVAGPYPERPLDLVERLLFLQRSGPFKTASVDAVTELARSAGEVRVEPGTVFWRAGDDSRFGLQVVHGIVRGVEPADGFQRFQLGASSVVGFLEAYARVPRSYDAVAETRVVALSMEPELLFDVMEDNVELGMSFVAFLATQLLDLYERLADMAEPAVP